MGSDYRKLHELETALRQLRDDLNDLSIKVSAEPRNTSLVIRRLNLMGRIISAQASLDKARDSLDAHHLEPKLQRPQD